MESAKHEPSEVTSTHLLVPVPHRWRCSDCCAGRSRGWQRAPNSPTGCGELLPRDTGEIAAEPSEAAIVAVELLAPVWLHSLE